MSSFVFHQTAPTGGDCTAPYDLEFTKELTVKEFVDEVLQRSEWGDIKVYIRDGKDSIGNYKRIAWIVYERDKLKSIIPDNIKDRVIDHAKSAGGWSCMDYSLCLKD